jgi:hypothetical protein
LGLKITLGSCCFFPRPRMTLFHGNILHSR